MDEKLMRRVARSRRASIERQAMRKKGPLTVSAILIEMQGYCKELNVPLYHTWTNERAFRAAKSWLADCEKNRQDPREVLYEVCKFWTHFKSGVVHDAKGNLVTLPDTVSFSNFYLFREQIMAWIDSNRDAPSRFGEAKVVDLNEWAKGGK